MKRLPLLALAALLLFAAHPTSAEPKAVDAAASPVVKTAAALVQLQLVEPLAGAEQARSRFSRARLPAQARRVRILDEQVLTDAAGHTFMRFAVDEHHGIVAPTTDDGRWRAAAITGCVYLDRDEVFVQRGSEFRPAAFLVGKNLKAAPDGTCQGEPSRS